MYQDANGGTSIEVTLEQETLWLTQEQLALLFNRERSVITKHIKNVYDTGELNPDATRAFFAQVQTEGERQVERSIQMYNLDVILSVGYRVNSRQGTQFRQWANQVLKEYLVKGYALDQRKLGEADARKRIQEELRLLFPINNAGTLSAKERLGMVELIERYSDSMALLNQFDDGDLPDRTGKAPEYILQEADCQAVITELRNNLMRKGEASNLFGHEKNKSFNGIIGAVNQTIFGEDAYPSVEQKAAHLLYFTIKNHPFSDGNKRIGAFLFVWYLEKNKHLVRTTGELKINDNALVALALLAAQSDPRDKEMIIRLIGHLVA
jgi:prophage maintenance system killer protein